MFIFSFFKDQFRPFYLLIISLGIINSLLFTAILMIVNNVLAGVPIPLFPGHEMYVFGCILVVSLLLNKFFQTNIVRITKNIIYQQETALLERLRNTDYQSFEKISKERVYTAFNDTVTLGTIPELLINAINDLVTIMCCLAYICWVSPLQGLCIIALMGLLLLFYVVRNTRIERSLNQLRDYHNHFYHHLNAMLLGFRQIKVSARKSNSIFNGHLLANRHNSRELAVSSGIRYLNNELVGRYSWYLVLGVILFILPLSGWMSKEQISTFVISVLYMIGPLSALLLLVPSYTNIKIAQERMASLYNDISHLPVEQEARETTAGAAFEQLTFAGVTYAYDAADATPGFTVGPLDITIEKGDTIFITGGNGSGKTTFIQLVTGLYRPASGKIYYNNSEVGPGKDMDYLQEVAVIFTDNYLFEENYEGTDLSPDNDRLRKYMALLRVEDILRFDTERNRIDTHLSAGQRKRLALIYALLENKSLLILDEWAAEQDPVFRHYFYHHIVPLLNKEGKTVIAVTHDEDYYHLAHKVVRFDYGNIVSVKVNDKMPIAAH